MSMRLVRLSQPISTRNTVLQSTNDYTDIMKNVISYIPVQVTTWINQTYQIKLASHGVIEEDDQELT
jgi:hypothetical protein